MEVVATFIEVACPLVEAVLTKHGFPIDGQTLGTGDQRFVRYAFSYGGAPHVIEIATDSPWMYSRAMTFESYMPSEWQDSATLAQGFASRLDRYLSGGTWGDEREEISIGRRLKRLFRHFSRPHGPPPG